MARDSRGRFIPGSNRPGWTPEGSVVVTGAAELLQKLGALPNAVFKRCLVVASRRAMRPVVTQAKATVAKASGDLQKAIGVKVKTYKRTGTVVTIVGARGGFGNATSYRGRQNEPALYSHLVEKGHRIVKAHSMVMEARRKGSGFTKQRGSGQVLGHVKGMPFLRPALVDKQAVVVASLQSEIGAFIEREAIKKVIP